MPFTFAMRIEDRGGRNTLEQSSFKKMESIKTHYAHLQHNLRHLCVPPSSIGVTYIPFSLLFPLDLVDGVFTSFKQSYTKR